MKGQPDQEQQAQFLAQLERQLNRPVEVVYQYNTAYNGFALKLTPQEAEWVATLLRVRQVQADLNAMAAGVFVATSAGNDGPGPSTVGSPANAPWATSVGASYFNRMYVSKVTLQIANQTVLRVHGTPPGVKNFRLVDAEGIPDSLGNTDGTCVNPFPPGTFLPTDAVLCERGFVATWAVGNFVNEGSAGAVILYNNADNHDYNSYLHPIPAVVTLRADGLAIKNLIQTNPGKTIRVNFARGDPVRGVNTLVPADTVAGFSSRGPNINEFTSHFIDVLKPDVTAPGLQILAGLGE